MFLEDPQILLSLNELGISGRTDPRCYRVCSSNYLGEFQEMELHILPNQRAVELTHSHLSDESDFAMSNTLLTSPASVCVFSGFLGQALAADSRSANVGPYPVMLTPTISMVCAPWIFLRIVMGRG